LESIFPTKKLNEESPEELEQAANALTKLAQEWKIRADVIRAANSIGADLIVRTAVEGK